MPAVINPIDSDRSSAVYQRNLFSGTGTGNAAHQNNYQHYMIWFRVHAFTKPRQYPQDLDKHPQKKMTAAIEKALSYSFKLVRQEDLPCPISKKLSMN